MDSNTIKMVIVAALGLFILWQERDLVKGLLGGLFKSNGSSGDPTKVGLSDGHRAFLAAEELITYFTEAKCAEGRDAAVKAGECIFHAVGGEHDHK